LQLSKAVLEAVNWYRSTEGQSSLNESGITWTTEQFGQKVFGWQRSFFYKMIKVGGLETEKVDNFKTACDTLEASGKDANRTIEGLIKFANGANATTEGEGEGEGEGEEGASVERVETIFTLTYKREEGNVSVRIASDGTIKTTNDKEAIQAAIDFLTTQLSNG
jgi:hypothetical protein